MAAPAPPIPDPLEALATDVPPPVWWRSEMAARFAECLYLLGMIPSAWDHHVFDSLECQSRFHSTTPAEWKQAIPFLESLLQDGGAIRAHFKALKSGAAEVALPPEGSGGGVGGRRKRKRDGASGSGGGVFKGVAEGNA